MNLKLITKISMIFLLVICLILQINAQESRGDFWNFNSTKPIDVKTSLLKKLPSSYNLIDLNTKKWEDELAKIPLQNKTVSTQRGYKINIPTPNGELQSFELLENNIISQEVAHLYTVKTYQGHSTDLSRVHIRCSYSPAGFKALIYDGSNAWIIEPFLQGDNKTYIVYRKKDLETERIKCSHNDSYRRAIRESDRLEQQSQSSTLRFFRIAMVSTHETSTHYGGSPYSTTNVLNALVSGLNMINPIFERDVAVSFTNVTTADLIYTDPANPPASGQNDDPFTRPFSGTGQDNLLTDAHNEMVAELTVSGFDIGHTFVYANTGGLASAGVCSATLKGQGFSGSNASTTSLFVDYGAHEIGHQFGASHNFVSTECATSSNNYRYEPGEGSSLMAYAGVCGAPASYQSTSDPYFHSRSITDMLNDISNFATCHSNGGGSNPSGPSSSAKTDITIPKNTPFVLVGTGSDANSAANLLTYIWEQYDGMSGAVSGPPSGASTTEPLFRYKSPSTTGNCRVFPEMSQVLAGNNTAVTWEKLPNVARTMNFNLAVRDNGSPGRVGNDQMVVTVANTGPFELTSPNGGENWVDNTNTVSWNVNNTNSHCPNVDIILSTDNGITFTKVAASVPNDGSHDITLSGVCTSTARIIVQCSITGNFKSCSTFFDASNAVFDIKVVVLPVDLVDFQASVNNNKEVELTWETASEINNSHFEIQSSQDGVNFETFARVNSQGNREISRNYAALDNKPFNGVNYYRLKQVDYDGSFEYSDIRTVNVEGMNWSIKISPNPSNGVINISNQNSKDDLCELRIYNQIGAVETMTIKFNEEIDLQHLSAGIYYLEFIANGQREVKKVLIEN